jgi:hypothetical protein
MRVEVPLRDDPNLQVVDLVIDGVPQKYEVEKKIVGDKVIYKLPFWFPFEMVRVLFGPSAKITAI